MEPSASVRLKFSRAGALTGLAAATLGAATTTRVFGADPIVLRVGAAPTDATAQLFYAQDLGLFKAAGLDVQINQMRNTGALAAALMAGSLEVITGSIVPIGEAHNHGLDIRAIAPGSIYDGPPSPAVVMVPATSSVTRGADLNGKTIAVNGLHDFTQVCMDAWIDATGGDSKTVKLIEIPFPETAAALGQGRVDAAMLVEPFITAAKGQAKPVGDAMLPIGKRFMITGWFAKMSWLTANRDAGRRYAGVMLQTAKWANTHREESAAILAKYMQISPEVLRTMVRSVYGETPLATPLIQPVVDAATKYIDMQRIAAADLMWSGR